MPSDTDQAAVEAVLAGDRDAFATLVERYQLRVYNAIYWMCGNACDAEELTQEAFVRAYFALPSHRAESKFSTWLFQIARNLCLTFLKNRDRVVSLDHPDRVGTVNAQLAPDAAASPPAVVERHEIGDALWSAVTDLPDDYREIIVMRHVAEMTYAEICETTGLPMGTVKSRLARARRRLKDPLVQAVAS